MGEITSYVTGLLLLAVPVVMLAVGVVPQRLPKTHPRGFGRLVQGAALFGVALSLLAFVAYGLGATRHLTVLEYSLGPEAPALALSVQVDRVTLAILTLVALLVALVARYSIEYLAGETDHGRFFRWLSLTAGFFMFAVIAENLVMFTVAAMLTASAINKLLTYYRFRRPAQMVAHKKLVFGRAADLCLLLASVLIGASLGTWSFDGIAAQVDTLSHGLPLALHAAAWLLVFAAILKSAQFPFHPWLLQVMEAPTQVSALFHAGIVYVGAIIVLRTHELLVADGGALIVLAVVGLMTAAIASLAMLTQTAIKSSLAWSTAGQLGFMLLELGLGLFVLGLLHLMAHSLYKAHAFLAAGSMVDLLRAPGVSSKRQMNTFGWGGLVALSGATTFAVAALFGISLATEPALLALGVIVSVAIAQPLLQSATLTPSWLLAVRVVPLAASIAVVYFSLHKLFEAAFGPTLGGIPSSATPVEYTLLVAVAVVFLGLSYVQSVLLYQTHLPWIRRLYVHVYNGLYVDLPVERLVYRLWPVRFGSRELSRRRGQPD